MIETLLGGLLGGVFRLAPEVLKWFDRKAERDHELAMQDKALDFEKLRGAQRMEQLGAESDAAWNVGALAHRCLAPGAPYRLADSDQGADHSAISNTACGSCD